MVAFPSMLSRVTRRARLAAAFVIVVGAAGCVSTPITPTGPNLEWDGPKFYSSGSVAIPIAGFGLNGSIDVLPVTAPATVTITRVVTNSGTNPVPAGYLINETVQAMQFRSVSGTAGFIPAPVAPVTNQTVIGPALAPGDSVPVTFTFGVPACGVYRETLTADSASVVVETEERDNIAEHYFGVAGTMAVNITVAPNNALSVWHAPAGAGPAPPWTAVMPAFPAITHTFTITAAAPGTTFYYNYHRPVVIGVFGTASQLIGPAPVSPPGPPVAGPVAITHQVTPRTNDPPPTDILLDVAIENFLPKVTAITSDGCAIRQQTAQVRVVHP
jgi:hypothetical protein